MSFFYKAPLDIEIRLENEDTRKTVEVKSQAKGKLQAKEKYPLYEDGETVRGTVTVRAKDGRRVDHLGIKVQLLGTIEVVHQDTKSADDFLSLSQELAAPGELKHPETYSFEFKNVEKQYESYHGAQVNLRYVVRVSVHRKSASYDVLREKELWCYSYNSPPEVPASVKMDIGIEDCLHLEFEYSKSRYSLKDVIVGRIYFLLVRLKIKHMELSLIRREIVNTGSAQQPQQLHNETLVRFEIMDGAPVRGETIPIRLFLGGFDLTPTYKDVNKKFSTKTLLSLVLIDEDARRYFKQSEIVLYRE
ncbi:hypothetical protein BABINDRAFT_8852 [Babjeviella inositovora NRRL Y-12698]|uniref:Vacuolar protein sorting-associated protein 26 n=1 Tax=Babjeviella inositovora NRRL Y-12698 TaxID=984486 RepID=A0A1E3QQN6_9ASCO|nr:uncharacterized protein BABINDRAFT_8852 [Babjeviella inositovora NRRL Y-12698]ODQ79277.1 hypothetical protein BABINDRAFT_8852 [Babjeviella inositovora NRRL Y-12698]